MSNAFGTWWRSGTMWVCLLVAAAVSYVVARAAAVSFTWDESWTFIHHILPGELYPVQHGLMSGNHHLLNVWGMWFFAKLFGQSELALRLPNVLAFVVYALAAARIALRAGSTVRSVTGFVLIMAHPYLLEFFGLARGYGMSIGFLLMSLWHLVRWAEDQGPRRHGALMFLFAGLSVLSHYIMLNYLAALGIVFIVRVSMDLGRVALWHLVRLPVLISVVVLAIVAPQVAGIVHGGGIIWGCGEFWSCAVSGLLLRLAGMELDTALFGPLVLLGAFFLLEAALQRWEKGHRAAATVATVTVLCAMLIAAEHFLLGMEWPRTRTALYFIPLPMVVLVLWLQASTNHRPWLWWPAAFLAMLFVANTLGQANLVRTSDWPEAAEVGHMVDLVRTDRAEHPSSRRAVLSAGPVSWGSLGYYFHRLHITDIDTVRCWPNEAHQTSDYYIVEPNGQPFGSVGAELMFRSVANVELYRRRDR